MDKHISLLITFSDSYTNLEKPGTSEGFIDLTAQQEQEDVYMLHFRTEVGNVMYFVSGRYWKAKPKLISQNTKDTLALLAEELRSMEKTFASFQEYYDRYYGWNDMETVAKKGFLNQFKPHLTRLESIQDGLQNYGK
ncbi:hypothetical protein [Paenibacillus alkalitolerans]|uniref:hypothetical protein n=1 Tax=Paenibacillus alkalitolerans TaxID=2799335 RepID=UPI0018F3292A|nr:hypothetical protein [Paenibacillus alkalitolerans]